MRVGPGVLGLAWLVACGESSAPKAPDRPTHTPTATTSVWPGSEPIDASLDLAPPPADAGPRSDCIPLVPDDGSADSAEPPSAADKLTTCLRYAARMPEAHDGRICYEVDLTSGIFARVPATAPAAATDAVARSLAEHPASAADGYVIKATGKDVSSCKGSACQTLHPDGFKIPIPAAGESCLTDAVLHAIPADVSPDGATLFVVRHESCTMGMNAWGETYDVKTKRRIARASLQVSGVVTAVAWIGQRILLRDCNEDGKVCALSFVDPKSPPPPARAANVAWNGRPMVGINPGGLSRFLAHAKDDLWAVVDRTGGNVAFVSANDGKVDHTLKLPIAPEVPRPLIVGLRPPQEMYLFYAQTGRVILIDLPSGQLAKSFTPPFCGGTP